MSSPWFSALLSGLLVALLNVAASGLQYGFGSLPLWFYLSQLLLLPAMFFPMRFFPRAALTANFWQRTGLFALGWAVPYAVYRFSGDVLSLRFNPLSSLLMYLAVLALLSLGFAVLRAPKEKDE